MAVFNLDIERYFQAQKELGYDLKGIVCLQYPIYCVHANIVVSTPDPLEKLDMAIMNCLLLKQSITKVEISKFLSISSSVVKYRIDKMIGEGLLSKEKKLVITEDGRRIILEGKDKRLQLKSYDFYLDGIDFQPLPNKFYDLKYRSAFISEDYYTYYTDHNGKIQTSKPFNPSVVHEPIEKDKVLRHIFFIKSEERINYQIPEGLEEVRSIDFTKMTFPLLVALLTKDGKPYRKVIDGFSSKGEQDFLVLFQAKLSDRLNNLELRLETYEDKKTEEKKFTFTTNWNEIDIKSNEPRLYFVAKEDLKFAFKFLYKLDSIDDINIINTEYEIGLKLTDNLFTIKNPAKVEVIRHLLRGRDYKFGKFYTSGVWIYFINFATEGDLIKALIETYEFLKEAKTRDLLIKDIILCLQRNNNWRTILVILEEYDILEYIDIDQHMFNPKE